MATKRYPNRYQYLLLTAVTLAFLLLRVDIVFAASPGSAPNLIPGQLPPGLTFIHKSVYGSYGQEGPLTGGLYMAYRNKVFDHIQGATHNPVVLQEQQLSSSLFNMSFGNLYQNLFKIRMGNFKMDGYMYQRLGR